LEDTLSCIVDRIPNTWRDLKREQFFAQIGEKVMVVDVHTIKKVFNISSKGWMEEK
jgi:hypothetical protein